MEKSAYISAEKVPMSKCRKTNNEKKWAKWLKNREKSCAATLYFAAKNKQTPAHF